MPRPAEPAPTHPDAVVAAPRAAALATFVSFAVVGAFTTLLYAMLYLPCGSSCHR